MTDTVETNVAPAEAPKKRGRPALLDGEQKRLIGECADAHMSAKEILVEFPSLKVSLSTIAKAVREHYEALGIDKRSPGRKFVSALTDERMVEMYNEVAPDGTFAHTLSTIAKACGGTCSVPAVVKRLKARGVSMRPAAEYAKRRTAARKAAEAALAAASAPEQA